MSHLRPQGAPQVGADALSRSHCASRAPHRGGDDEPGHEPADGGELVGVAVGEGLGPQQLDVGGGVSDGCIRERAVFVTRWGSGQVEGRAGRVDRRLAVGGDENLRTGIAEEVTRERGVVGGEVVVAGDEARPPRPVDVAQVGGVEEGEPAAEGEDLSGPYGESGRSQLSAEARFTRSSVRICSTAAATRRASSAGTPGARAARISTSRSIEG